ncbi:unnamed protein product [Linum tenue]|uniref:Uncharacterized protein n=1 Tax=Linum tenue TaxID=586396 RepID=A0AAV0R755_9ROSI|nr:unnamed protein product [Linum tenue]
MKLRNHFLSPNVLHYHRHPSAFRIRKPPFLLDQIKHHQKLKLFYLHAKSSSLPLLAGGG